jgi:hypothetical protein
MQTKEADQERYKNLLNDDPNLRRWFQNNAKESIIVAEVYLRRLGFFCLQNNTSPKASVALPKRKMEEIAFDYIERLESKVNPKSGQKYAPSYSASNLKTIIS